MKISGMPNMNFKLISAIVGFVAACIGIARFLFPNFAGIGGEKLPMPILTSYIGVTTPNEPDHEFLPFLEENTGMTVFLDMTFDFSVGTDYNYDVYESCNYKSVDHDDFAVLVGPAIHVPVYFEDDTNGNGSGQTVRGRPYFCGDTAVRINAEPEKTMMSYGGTGVVHASTSGFFTINRQALPGPQIGYVLSEVDADAELLSRFQMAKKRMENN